MKAYKGFNKQLQCTPSGTIFQYEIGKEYKEDDADLCTNGFHACENPLDCFNYYQPGDNRYCEVDLDANDQTKDDTKRVGSRIKIVAEIGLKGMIEGAVKFIFEKCKVSKDTTATTGESANAATTGDCANAAALGINSCAKGVIGSYIVVAEWAQDSDYKYQLKTAKTHKVDGKVILPNTYYKLVDGKFIAVDEG